MRIIVSEPMSYKQQKKSNESLVQLKIIRLNKVQKIPKTEIARIYFCSRNTVSNIIKKYELNISKELKYKIENTNLNLTDLELLLQPIQSKSTRPKSHPKQVNKEQEEYIINYHNKRKYGAKRIQMEFKRKFSIMNSQITELEHSLSKLKLGAIAGVFKRNKLRTQKIRSTNRERRSLYNYDALEVFSNIHVDTKHILDKHALPKHIYDKFNLTRNLPIYEWNIMEAKSRYRFVGYSHNLNSDFGLKFILSTIQYIRGITSNYDTKITVWGDNGIEFCSGSEKKEEEWNKYFKVLNAEFKSYEAGHDIRKNLIERSHRTDDEEFFIPRGQYISDRNTFLKEATAYSYYFNYERSHSGKCMKGRTPFQVLKDTGIRGIELLKKYPTMILEETIRTLSDIISPIKLELLAKKYFTKYPNMKKIDEKTLADWKAKNNFYTESAQNVLRHYHF